MMDKYDHFFTPDHVDEQIEDHARKWPVTPESQLLREMQQVAQQIRAEQNDSLQRTWLRLQQKSRGYAVFTQQRGENTMQGRPFVAFPQDAGKPFPKKPARRVWHALSMSAAVLVVAMLIGSLVVMFNFMHASTANSRPTPTPRAMQRGEVVSTVRIADDNFQVLAWSPDSQRVAGGLSGHVQIWDATTGRLLLDVATHDELFSLAWSPDGRYLAISGRTVRIINPNTGALVHEFPRPLSFAQPSFGPYLSAMTALSGGGVPIESTAWSPDGSLMASAIGNEVVVWKPDTGAVVYTFRGQSGPNETVNTVSWSSDGKYIASTSYHKTLQVWNAHTGQVIFSRPLSDNSDPFAYVAWAPSGMTLAFISDSHTTEVWNVATNTKVTNYPTSQPGRFTWSPDGSEIASINGKNVSIWNARTGDALYHFTMQGERVVAVAWSPNGKYIVSSDVTEHSAEAQVWDS